MNAQGTHHRDRMRRILDTCRVCGTLEHTDTVHQRNGEIQHYPVRDVDSAEKVVVSPTYEKYGLHVSPRVLDRIKSMAGQFAVSLNVPSTRIEVDGDIIYVCIPRAVPDVVAFEEAWAISPDQLPPGWLLLGLDDNRDQARMLMDDTHNVHCAVIGMPGSGKSTLMQTMILSAQMAGGADLALLDPKREFWPFSGHDSVYCGGIFTKSDDIRAALALLLDRENTRPLFCFLDEAADLCDSDPRTRQLVTRLAQTGRHNGVHLVLGSQRAIGSMQFMSSIETRLVGHVANPQDAFWATSRPNTAAERLHGKGDFIYCNGENVVHFQAAIVSTALRRQWMGHYPPRYGTLPQSTLPSPMPAMGEGPGVRAIPEGVRAIPEAVRTARTVSPIPARAVRECQFYYTKHRKLPSLHWLECTFGFNKRYTGRRCLNLAAEKMGLPLPYPDWEAAYAPSVDAVLEVA